MYAAFSKAPSSNEQSLDKVMNVKTSQVKTAQIQRRPKTPEHYYRHRQHVGMKGLELFSKTVAIAGIDEAFNNRFKPDRIMFRLALTIALGMIFYEAYAMVKQYRKQITIFDARPMMERMTAPFPNVSICVPFSINESAFTQKSIVTEKAARLMKKHKITVSDTLDYMKDMVTMTPNDRNFASPLHATTKQIVQSTANLFEKDGESLFKHVAPPCSQTLSNCAFDGQPFDCCTVAKLYTVIPHWCFHINLNEIDEQSRRSSYRQGSRDTIRIEKSGFSVDVVMDWTHGHYVDGSGSDGFHIFIDKIPIVSENPVAIPTGTQALISLAEPHQLKGMTDCYSLENVPKLKYFGHYDPNGVKCMTDWLQYNLIKNIGGTVPLGTSFSSISFDRISILSLSGKVAGGNLTETIGKNWFDSTVAKKSECLPLCSRWAYRVLSAGYGYIQYKDKVPESNLTWSRIRVIMPESCWSKKEEPKTSSYLIVCDIGGMMGVYIGFSVITFAELFAHGFYIFWYKWQRRRVQPLGAGKV